jgi:hypothetical protein
MGFARVDFQHFPNEKLLKVFQQFLIWKMPIRWENGLGGSGGYERIFLGCVCLKSVKKNPFVSA